MMRFSNVMSTRGGCRAAAGLSIDELRDHFGSGLLLLPSSLSISLFYFFFLRRPSSVLILVYVCVQPISFALFFSAMATLRISFIYCIYLYR